MKCNPLPPLEYLNECFELDFNSESGLIFKNSLFKKIVGYKDRQGYFAYKINLNGVKRNYQIHRIIYAMYHNMEDLNDKLVDHIDRNKSNNNIENLRLVNHTENFFNRNTKVNQKSGVLGVFWATEREKWFSEIQVGGKRYKFGPFIFFEDAVLIRKSAEEICNNYFYSGSRDESLLNIENDLKILKIKSKNNNLK